MAYYGRPGVRRIHIPKNCYPAHGWKELSTATVGLPRLDPRGETLSTRKFLFAKDLGRRMVLYAIAHGHGSSSDEYLLRLRQTVGAVWGGPMGPLVTIQVSAPVSGDADAEAVEAMLGAFLSDALPELYPLLPFGERAVAVR